MGTPITDPHLLEACRFLRGYYASIGGFAPPAGSSEEQHAILVLSAYIEDRESAALASEIADARFLSTSHTERT